jgi:hypothetical protein
MTNLETRRYAMLARVRDFGEGHRDLFPQSSEGGQAFATVAAAVAKLDAHARSKASSARDGTKAKVAARESLVTRLESIGRTARVIAEKTPGFDDPFQLPKKNGDRSLVTMAQVFIEDAESRKAPFVRHGLPETFIEDLRVLTDLFERASHVESAAKERWNVARKGIAAAIVSGLAAVRQLDVIVANQLEHDADSLAQWAEARKVEYPRRRRYVPAATELEGDSEPPISTPTPASSAIAEGEAKQPEAAVVELPKAS